MIRSHVPLIPPEGGCTAPSFIMCEQLRAFAVERLLRYRGRISDPTLAQVELRLRYLLELP
jgi:mRNA-degrading endonuclease toxin of MazEF toxin-antitoxin module